MLVNHNGVIKRNHFPRYSLFVRGIHRSPVKSPHKGQWRGALMFSLICVWINGWVNNREAGDLRRYHTHYVVIVMWVISLLHNCIRLHLWYILRCLIRLICWISTWRSRQDGRRFPDDILKCIFKEKVWISIKMSLKFVPKVQIDNIPALIQIMAWCWLGDKPLSGPMMDILLTLICVTRC